MRTVFFGTPELAVPTLAALAETHEVTAVVCQPDKPKGRSKKLVPPPVKVWAEAHGIPVMQPVIMNDGTFEAWLKDQAPEVCTVAAYGRLLKQPILDVPPKGWLNVHPSLLPRWRGPSPIQTALLKGDSETGVTIMRIILAMDAGDMLLQESTPIDPEENSAELAERLGVMGAKMMLEAMALVEKDQATFTRQASELVTISKLIDKTQGVIDWNNNAQRIHNQVRACVPWPVAQCSLNGNVYRIHKSRVIDKATDAAPGIVTEVAKTTFCIATGDRQLEVLTIQAQGKKAMPTDAFLRGNSINVGDRFEVEA